jgi:hypothetical protein
VERRLFLERKIFIILKVVIVLLLVIECDLSKANSSLKNLPMDWKLISQSEENYFFENSKSRNGESIVLQVISAQPGDDTLIENISLKSLTNSRDSLLSKIGLFNYSALFQKLGHSKNSHFRSFVQIESMYMRIDGQPVQVVERQAVVDGKMYTISYQIDTTALNQIEHAQQILDTFQQAWVGDSNVAEVTFEPSAKRAPASSDLPSDAVLSATQGSGPDNSVHSTDSLNEPKYSEQWIMKSCQDIPAYKRRSLSEPSFSSYMQSGSSVVKDCALDAWQVVKDIGSLLHSGIKLVSDPKYRSEVETSVGWVVAHPREVGTALYNSLSANLDDPNPFYCMKTSDQIRSICRMAKGLIKAGLLANVLSKIPMAAGELKRLARIAKDAVFVDGAKELSAATEIPPSLQDVAPQNISEAHALESSDTRTVKPTDIPIAKIRRTQFTKISEAKAVKFDAPTTAAYPIDNPEITRRYNPHQSAEDGFDFVPHRSSSPGPAENKLISQAIAGARTRNSSASSLKYFLEKLGVHPDTISYALNHPNDEAVQNIKEILKSNYGEHLYHALEYSLGTLRQHATFKGLSEVQKAIALDKPFAHTAHTSESYTQARQKVIDLLKKFSSYRPNQDWDLSHIKTQLPEGNRNLKVWHCEGCESLGVQGVQMIKFNGFFAKHIEPHTFGVAQLARFRILEDQLLTASTKEEKLRIFEEMKSLDILRKKSETSFSLFDDELKTAPERFFTGKNFKREYSGNSKIIAVSFDGNLETKELGKVASHPRRYQVAVCNAGPEDICKQGATVYKNGDVIAFYPVCGDFIVRAPSLVDLKNYFFGTGGATPPTITPVPCP